MLFFTRFTIILQPLDHMLANFVRFRPRVQSPYQPRTVFAEGLICKISTDRVWWYAGLWLAEVYFRCNKHIKVCIFFHWRWNVRKVGRTIHLGMVVPSSKLPNLNECQECLKLKYIVITTRTTHDIVSNIGHFYVVRGWHTFTRIWRLCQSLRWLRDAAAGGGSSFSSHSSMHDWHVHVDYSCGLHIHQCSHIT